LPLAASGQDPRMRDRVIVVTGASSGIGAALAEEIAARGGRPVLAARRAAELEAVRSRCGAESIAVPADATRRGDLQRVLDSAVGRFGRVDAWVNNAGQGITRPVSQLTDEDVDDMLRINVKSVLYGMQVALAHFQSRGGVGHIVNISSLLGRIPFIAPQRSAYSAAKHAVDALTTALRAELRQTHPGIHVSLVLPGVVATEFGTRAKHGGVDSRAFPGAQPVEEVARVIADVLERPQAEAYTRPQYQRLVASYYAAEDAAAFEAANARPPG
jgi:short-subunit dehydrogenase